MPEGPEHTLTPEAENRHFLAGLAEPPAWNTHEHIISHPWHMYISPPTVYHHWTLSHHAIKITYV
jgi:hypothetical protein